MGATTRFPLKLFADLPIKKGTSKSMCDVQGKAITHHGQRVVPLTLPAADGGSDVTSQVSFEVAAVRRPLLSLGNMVASGFAFFLAPGPKVLPLTCLYQREFEDAKPRYGRGADTETP